MDLKGRNFLTLKDFTPEEITYLLDLAADLKEKKKNGVPVDHYHGKNIALIFEKTSTRTRCAFEVAAHDMGMGTTYLDPSGSQIGKKESIKDTARVLGRMYDGIEYRGFGQEIVEDLAKYAGVPVWNGLTNEYHPTQMLADMLTIREHFGTLKGIKLTYTTDTRPTDSIRKNAKDSDLFICEGMYGEREKAAKAVEYKHMTFYEAAELARETQVKELWLTHYSPSLTRPEPYMEDVRKIFPNAKAGKDGRTGSGGIAYP